MIKQLFNYLKTDNQVLLVLLFFTLWADISDQYKYLTFGVILINFLAKRIGIIAMSNYSSQFFLLILMFTTYFLFGAERITVLVFLELIIPSCFLFQFSRNYVKYRNDDKSIFFFLSCIVLCIGLSGLYMTINDIIEYGIVNMDVMSVNSVMEKRGTSLIAAQIMPFVAGISLLFVKSENEIISKHKSLLVIFSVVAMLGLMHFISRTSLFVLAACLLIGLLYKVGNKGTSIIYICLLLLLGYMFTKSDLYELYEAKNEISDFSTGNGRTERISYWLEVLKTKPFGVADASKYQYSWAHNLWVDFAKNTGWIPGLSLLAISLCSLRDAYRIYFNSKYSDIIRVYVVALVASFTLAFSAEPVFEGAKVTFLLYFMICGTFSGIADQRLK